MVAPTEAATAVIVTALMDSDVHTPNSHHYHHDLHIPREYDTQRS